MRDVARRRFTATLPVHRARVECYRSLPRSLSVRIAAAAVRGFFRQAIFRASGLLRVAKLNQ